MDKFKTLLKKLILIIIVLGIVVLVFLNLANYSSGYRAGVPIKVSKKGVIFKTWEGQMNVGGLTTSSEGTIPTQFDFTVKKSADGVLNDIDQAIVHGKRVKLHYHEKYVKFFWLGDTKYFVYKVEILE